MLESLSGRGSAVSLDSVDGTSGPRTIMQLHMKYLLEPASAPRLAADVVAAASDISDAELDYSPGSIGLVEEIVDGFRSDGVTGGEVAESLVSFGCYVGEVLIRHGGGVWCHAPAAHGAVPLVVEMPGAGRCSPIDWVFSRLEHGSAVSISALYTQAGYAGGRVPGPHGARRQEVAEKPEC
jgi:hypothetical protein